jgi:uncharacterized protein YdaU (DUF1376 family)
VVLGGYKLNYFPFHLGDYSAHTGHLEPMEDLAYRRLLDLYYLREGPLPSDIQATAKLVRMRSMSDDVESVLKEFFILTDAGWVHGRCEIEIAEMKVRQEAARAKAKKRWDKERSADSNAAALKNDATASVNYAGVLLPTPTPTPTPNTIEPKGSLSPAKLPTCPTQSIIDLYHSELPELPSIKILSEPRKKAISNFWKWVLTSKRTDGENRANGADEAMAWIGSYFRRAKENDFLMGRNPQTGPHSSWQCDLDFLLTEKGKKHVIEKTKAAS